MTPQARPYTAVRRAERLRWVAGLAVEFLVFGALVVAVVLAAGLNTPVPT